MTRIVFSFVLLLITLNTYSNEQERIISFNANINIETNGEIKVSETIKVYGGIDNIKRGIVRTLPLHRVHSEGKKQRTNYRVTEVYRDGKEEKFFIERANGQLEIFIGNKDVHLKPGIYEYEIRYTVRNQIGFFDDFEEIYWNVTGSDWAFSIEKASATIQLPDSVQAINTACYTGATGSTARDCQARVESNTVFFETTTPLHPGEGFTVAASFPKGTIVNRLEDTPAEKRTKLIYAAIAIILILVFYYLSWRKVGVDPQKPVIIPTFDPPYGWSPAVARFINRRVFDSKVLTSAIINMAVKGSIKILYKDKKYHLENTGSTESLTYEEKLAHDALFAKDNSIIIDYSERKTIDACNKILKKTLKSRWNIKKYFSYNSKYLVLGALINVLFIIIYIITTNTSGFTPVFIPIYTILIVTGIKIIESGTQNKKTAIKLLAIIMGTMLVVMLLAAAILQMLSTSDVITTSFLMLLMILFIIYSFLIEAPTNLGAEVTAALQGFRMYMETAEENRLNLLTPPQKTPELFEKLLPYAVALDVENEWSNKFDSVLNQSQYQPHWYSGNKQLTYTSFASALSKSFDESLQSSTYRTSGSSGSGFAGGGGGGGGGRGW